METFPDGIILQPEMYDNLMNSIQRDCRVLESFKIMDYSLLIGIHNLDLALRVSNCQAHSEKRISDAAALCVRKEKSNVEQGCHNVVKVVSLYLHFVVFWQS